MNSWRATKPKDALWMPGQLAGVYVPASFIPAWCHPTKSAASPEARTRSARLPFLRAERSLFNVTE